MNAMELRFSAKMENESFVRCSVIAFLMPLQLNVQEVMEIKTIVSEGVSNAILHGYDKDETKFVKLKVEYDQNKMITLIIEDNGKGIEDIDLALQPLYTTKANEERCGMGMSIMSTFADAFTCISNINEGTKLVIKKQI